MGYISTEDISCKGVLGHGKRVHESTGRLRMCDIWKSLGVLYGPRQLTIIKRE